MRPDPSAAADWRCRGVWGDDGGGGDNKNCGRRHGDVKESTTTEMPSARRSDTGGNASLMVDVLFAWRLSWAWVGGINNGIYAVVLLVMVLVLLVQRVLACYDMQPTPIDAMCGSDKHS